jgi:hypothetical protein
MSLKVKTRRKFRSQEKISKARSLLAKSGGFAVLVDIEHAVYL